MHDFPLRIGEDLEFDMTRIGQIFFDIHSAEAECRHRNRLRGLQRLFQFHFIRDNRHPYAPSASRAYNNGISDFTCNFSGTIKINNAVICPQNARGFPEALTISRRAATLSPTSSRTRLEGPMNLIPRFYLAVETPVLLQPAKSVESGSSGPPAGFLNSSETTRLCYGRW